MTNLRSANGSDRDAAAGNTKIPKIPLWHNWYKIENHALKYLLAFRKLKSPREHVNHMPRSAEVPDCAAGT